MRPRFALIPALALVASGCGKGLNGSYAKCIQLSTSSSKLATFGFPDSANFSYVASSYTTPDCVGTATTAANATGTYTTASSNVSGAQDITFTFASGNPSGTTLYQIYKLDQNNLFLGDTSGNDNGTSDALRPTAFESTPYARQ